MVSYIPSPGLLTLRKLKNVPLRLKGKPHEVDFEFFRYLNLQSPVIIDVGANRGQSIESFKSVIKDPDIHSVEPNSILAESLRKRFPDVTVYNIGLGEVPGKMKLFIPRYGHTFWDTRASLSPEYAQSFLNDEYFFLFNEKRSGLETLSVSIDLLDNLEIKPDILKIDAEGLEEQILLGGSKTLSNHPIVLLESPDDATVNLLQDIGYEIFSFDGRRLTAKKGKLNTLFLSRRHHADFLGKFGM